MATQEHPKVPVEIESGIQNFDHGKLKHADTEEKNPLPSSESEYSAAITCIGLATFYVFISKTCS